MISLIKGKIINNDGEKITVLTVGGVGYEIFVNTNGAEFFKIDTETEVLTYLSVRENAMDLFGFKNKEEKNLFEKFLLVSGIGPKTALRILSLGSVGEISSAIVRSDIAYLTKVSGMGKKTAERLVVELKNKLGTNSNIGQIEGFSNEAGDVIEGLIALGYNSTQARDTVQKIKAEGKTSEQLMKEALKLLGKR
ncbi:MAG TPA: Holliday junction branch migration protein RuvA [Candidatus Magasanikbacteria bacterium]|nr:Holliday junction branch migration protein RuvA [Candidatus Magasanikbacteria bacterium]